MAKREIKNVEPEVEMAVTPITSKKRKTSKKTDVLAPVPVKTRARAPRSKSTPDTAENTVSSEKPDMAKKLVTSKKRKSGNADEEATASKATKKRKVSATKEQVIIPDVPIIHDDTKQWDVISILGRVTNAHFNSKWPIYCYELKGQSTRWSWDQSNEFKNPAKDQKMRKAFDIAHQLGTKYLKEGSDELEEACRKHAVAPPAASGAPTVGLTYENGKVFAWFGPDGYTNDNPFLEAPETSPGSSEQSSEVKSRPKASMKKTTTKKSKNLLPSPSSPKEPPDFESRPKASMKKSKKDSLSPLGAASPKATNVSAKENDGMSSKQRQNRGRVARNEEKPSVPPPVKPTKVETSVKDEMDRIVRKYSRFTHPLNGTPLQVDPAEIPSDSVYLVTESRGSREVTLNRNASMQTTIVGLYRRRLSASSHNKSTRTATYTLIYTQDPKLTVHKHLVNGAEHGKKQFYLIKWTETTTDGEQEYRQGFVPTEHLHQHVDYLPQIEEFEHEQMAAVYEEMDEAARQKRKVEKEKERKAEKKLQEVRERILEDEEAEKLRLRTSIAK